MKYFKITLKKAQNDLNGMLSSEIVSKCYFCQKRCKIDSLSFKNLHRISGFKEFFCGFCVRNGFNTRCNRDVLILNFKNVFSYYYAQNYLNLKNMWISEIKDLVQIHEKVGLKNPVFCYDQESMYWFINFAKVGEAKRQINIEEVYKCSATNFFPSAGDPLCPAGQVDQGLQKVYCLALKTYCLA